MSTGRRQFVAQMWPSRPRLGVLAAAAGADAFASLCVNNSDIN